MTELVGRLLVGGRLVPGRLRLADGRIAEVDTQAPVPAGELPIVAPGLIDLHVHGFGGVDAVEDLARMARALAAAGTTAFQPTLFPDEPARLGGIAQGVHERARELASEPGAARVLGLHLEGPFVNPEAAGALPRERMAAPSVEALRTLLGPASGDAHGIRTMTVAPELPGGGELIDELVRSGIAPSLGHSRATCAEARAAAGEGRTGATHLFNAMPLWHHREVGLAGFALSPSVGWAEIIGDLAHVSGEAIELALRARGPRELCLVSDSLPGAGTGCDAFHWHGRRHGVHDGAAWFVGERGERLAGSVTGQLEAARRLVRAGVVSAEEALTMASEAPARALDLVGELGSLVPGARADLIVLGPELELIEVRLAGELSAGELPGH